MNIGGNEGPTPAVGTDRQPQEVIAASMLPDLQAHMMAQFKQFVIANTENVGSKFAETARKMHYGEEANRNIRGRVSADESNALRALGLSEGRADPAAHAVEQSD